jgi:hypothetical protein
MKALSLVIAIAFSLSTIYAQDAPKGFTKGSIVLSDSSVLTGYIKEKIRGNASLTFVDAENKKKNYDGHSLVAATIGDEKYICIKGDFFKVVTDGRMKLLQKSSDASSKPIYNGNQAIFINGTEGNPGDHYIYTTSSKKLKHITRKSFASVTAECFSGCEQALAKAKSINEDISRLNEAVDAYNLCGNASR